MPVKPLLCLDLEGTLISNAVSQVPRPFLYQFLECAAQLCDLMIYTSVSAQRVDAIKELLVAERKVPPWFRDLAVVHPEKTVKPKALCGRDDAFLLDDQSGVIAPEEGGWWIQINEYLPPYSEDDDALCGALVKLQEIVQRQACRGEFRVSAERLSEIGENGFRNMEDLDADDIGKYSE